MNLVKRLIAFFSNLFARQAPPVIVEDEEEQVISPTDMLALSPLQLRIMRLMLRANEMSLTVLERALQSLPPNERPSQPEIATNLRALIQGRWLVQVEGSYPPVYRTGHIKRTGALNEERKDFIHPPMPNPTPHAVSVAAESKTPPSLATAARVATSTALEEAPPSPSEAKPEAPKPDLAARRRSGADRLGDFWKAVDEVAERPPKIDVPTSISSAFMAKTGEPPTDPPPPQRPAVVGKLFEEFVAKPKPPEAPPSDESKS